MAIKHFKKHLLSLMTATLVGSMLLTVNTKAASAASATSVSTITVTREDNKDKATEENKEEVKEAVQEEKAEEFVDQEYEDYLEGQKDIAQDLLEKGIKIDQSVTKNGIIVHFERILADAHSYRILCSMEKVDHTAFIDADNLNFEDFLFGDEKEIKQMISSRNGEHTEWSYADWIKEEAEKDPNLKAFIKEDGTVDEEGADAYFAKKYEEEAAEMDQHSGGGSSSSWGTCQTDLSTDKKIYFLLEGSNSELLPKEAQIYMGSLVKSSQEVYEMTFDMLSYLKQQKEAPQLEDNAFKKQEAEWLERLKEDNDSHYEMEKTFYDQLPDKVIAKGKLNVELCKEIPDQKIDNIGFVNGQLQIVTRDEAEGFRRSSGMIALVDQEGNEIYPISSWSDSAEKDGKYINYDYVLYDIKDINELSKVKVEVHAYQNNIIAEGPWTAKVNLKEAKYVTKNVNKEINYTTKSKAKLSKVDISPISITITFEGVSKDDHNNNAELTITMKDGTVYTLNNNDSDNREKNIHSMTFMIRGKSIDPANVASITFLGQNIKL